MKSVTDEKADVVADVGDTGQYVIKLEMGPIADAGADPGDDDPDELDGDVDVFDLGKLMVNGEDMSTSTNVIVDASQRTITVSGLEADADVLVSYKYVEQSFQVDVDAKPCRRVQPGGRSRGGEHLAVHPDRLR